MTHVDELLAVSDEQVAQDSGLVEVSQADHVLHPMDGGGMHGLDVGGVLGRDPMLLEGQLMKVSLFIFMGLRHFRSSASTKGRQELQPRSMPLFFLFVLGHLSKM